MEAFRSKDKSTTGSCFSKGKSAFRGVDKKGNRWRAAIMTKGKFHIDLGMHEEEAEAARAYDSAAFHVHRE